MAAVGPSVPYDTNTLTPEKKEMLSIMEISRRDFSFQAKDCRTCSFVIQNLSLVLFARAKKELSLLEEKLHGHHEYKVFESQLQQAYQVFLKPLEVDSTLLFSGWLFSFQLQLTIPSFDYEKMVVLPGRYQSGPLT